MYRVVSAIFCCSIVFAQAYKCEWAVNGTAGGEMSGSAYLCGATAGQTAAGQLTGTSYWAHIGFWHSDIQTGLSEGQSPPQTLKPTLLVSPNPFGECLLVYYSFPAPGLVLLRIHDLTGRLVKTLVQGEQKPGGYGLSWNGTDEQGRRLSPGIYFCRLISVNVALTEKLVMSR